MQADCGISEERRGAHDRQDDKKNYTHFPKARSRAAGNVHTACCASAAKTQRKAVIRCVIVMPCESGASITFVGNA